MPSNRVSVKSDAYPMLVRCSTDAAKLPIPTAAKLPIPTKVVATGTAGAAIGAVHWH